MEFGIVPKQAPSPAEAALNATPTDFVHPAQTQFQFLESRHTFEDHPVFLQIMCMTNSYFVWVGTIPPVMGLVELCMPGKDVGPVSTTLIGNSSSMAGQSIATKLIQKTGASVMVSYNISETIPNIKEFVEAKIFESLKANQAK